VLSGRHWEVVPAPGQPPAPVGPSWSSSPVLGLKGSLIPFRPFPGRLAQLGERRLDKAEVTGSSPVSPIAQRPVFTGRFAFLGQSVVPPWYQFAARDSAAGPACSEPSCRDWGWIGQLGHTDPAFTLRVYRHSMRRDGKAKAKLRSLVGSEDQGDHSSGESAGAVEQALGGDGLSPSGH
jgi:hypothetical protein